MWRSVISALALAMFRSADAMHMFVESPAQSANQTSGLAVPVSRSHEHDAVDVTHGSGKGLSKEVHVPWIFLPLSGVLVCSIVIFIYGPNGPAVVASVLTYVLALSTMKLAVKWVFQTHSYPFAKFVTSLHFIAGAVVTYTILRRRHVPIPQPTAREFVMMICPIALAVALSIGANNMALLHISAAFTEIIGATTCLTTIALVIIMGMPFNKWLTLPACVVAFGCALGSGGEINFNLIGTVLCFSSNIFRSLKVVMQQKLLIGESKDKFDPVALLFWISLPSAAVMLLSSCLTEGFAPYTAFVGREASEVHGLVFAILVSCVNATILNLAQLYVTKDLGAVGSQLVAQAKMILTVLGGLVLFGEAFTQLEVIGFMLALVGVYAFSRMDQAFKEEQKKLESEKLSTEVTSYKSADMRV